MAGLIVSISLVIRLYTVYNLYIKFLYIIIMNKKELFKTGLLAVTATGLFVQGVIINEWQDVSAYQDDTIVKTLEVDTLPTTCPSVEVKEEVQAQVKATAQASARAESKDSGKIMYNIHIKEDNKVNNHDKINSNNNNSKKVK